MKRILMLHGFSQNGRILYQRTSAIRKAADKSCEFVFLDAPHVLVPADFPSDLEALDRPKATVEDEDPTLTPRAWWRSNDERTKYYGVNEALGYVKDFLEKQEVPFDVVFGFSQGATMAALLTTMLERPTAYTPVPFITNSTLLPVHPPFKSAIIVSAPSPTADELKHLFTPSPNQSLGIQTKILHLIGKNDPIVPPSRSWELVKCCVEGNCRVEEHDGGHFIPSKTTWRNFFASYLASEDPFSVPSPIPPLTQSETPGMEINRL